MSLKAFHIFFIVLATLLAVALGLWGVDQFRQSGSWWHISLGVGSSLSSIALAWYGLWFLRKLKDVG